MVRLWVILVAVLAIVVLFALVDAVLSDARRVRGVPKVAWIVIILILPLVGALLWFAIGKPRKQATRNLAPDDDPRFTGAQTGQSSAERAETDRRIKDLEEQLKKLDEETYPGEPGHRDEPGGTGGSSTPPDGSNGPRR